MQDKVLWWQKKSDMITKFYKKKWILASLLFILVVTFASHWLVTFMYYGQDDHSLIFKLQHIPESAGQYGAGLWARNTPYKYIVVPFAPIYYAFGTNPLIYFVISIFNYYLASVALFYLTYRLTKNKLVALSSGLIFAAGYIGSDSMLRLTNSFQMPHTIIFMCLTMAVYKQYIDKKSLKLYVLSLILFFLTIEGLWVRSQGMIFLIVGLELLYNFGFLSILRMVPFAYLYNMIYISGNGALHEVSDFQTTLFTQPFLVINTFWNSILNLFIPDKWLPKDASFATIIFIVVLGILLIKKKSKAMWYGIGFAIATISAYMLHDPDRVIISTHRYSTIPYVGIALFLAEFLRRTFKTDKAYLTVVFALVLLNTTQNNIYFYTNIVQRNNPTRRFYQSLKENIPTIPKDSVIFFDVEENGESRRQFSEAFGVGNMPDSTAIAWQYNIDRYDFYMPETFLEVLDLLKKEKTSIDKVFTLYFDSDTGFTNTTDQSRAALQGAAKPIIAEISEKINFKYSTPVEITLEANIRINEKNIIYSKENINLPLYLEYLSSREDYYKNVTADAKTDWMTERDINLADNDINTYWMSDRLEWRYYLSDTIMIDLKTNQNIGAIALKYPVITRAPTKYQYECSVDNTNWSDLGSYSFNPSKKSDVIFNKVTPSICRYIRVTINGSQEGDSPEIAEIEVINNKFRDINIELAQKVQENPFKYLVDSRDLSNLKSYITKYGISTQACIKTDKSSSPICLPIKIYPNKNNYSFIVPPSGTLIKSIELLSKDEINIKLNQIRLTPQSFTNLVKSGYVPNYEER